MVDDEMWAQVRKQSERLIEEFQGTFSLESIDNLMIDSLGRFRDAQVDTFVPLLAYRLTRERLRAIGQTGGLIMKDRPEILYVCVHNAGRSQMAAVLTTHLSGGRVHVRSAGSAPASALNPRVVEAMQELGLDMSREFPKPLTDDIVEASDVVITMGCGDACPLFPGTRYLDWELDDPAGQDLPAVRRIRDEIRDRVELLLRELGVLEENTTPV